MSAPGLSWLVGQRYPDHQEGTQLVHAAIVVIALWSLIAALVFSGNWLGWLVFADGLALAGIALVNLGVHEFSTERVVHELQIVGPESSSSQMQREAA